MDFLGTEGYWLFDILMVGSYFRQNDSRREACDSVLRTPVKRKESRDRGLYTGDQI